MRETATLSYSPGDGMRTLRVTVTRDSDGVKLGVIRYQPDSAASCEAMELELASIAGRYAVTLTE